MHHMFSVHMVIHVVFVSLEDTLSLSLCSLVFNTDCHKKKKICNPDLELFHSSATHLAKLYILYTQVSLQ